MVSIKSSTIGCCKGGTSLSKLAGILDQGLHHKLLCKQPSRRIGAFGLICEHPIFQGLDWVQLEQRKVEPPFIPVVEPLAVSSTITRSGII
ncbi:uncharacterized protein LOC128636037 isoform X2 [Bombina bombina]|uniref:uncharacterized protein LOC128636037 isoform X2 n=1 Tax=Bombina bombina TaxID=8345 RepID=UPI00235A609F|nr:uncharacterized protein LOC128636037 isoform X2 [Bombina bombina]